MERSCWENRCRKRLGNPCSFLPPEIQYTAFFPLSHSFRSADKAPAPKKKQSIHLESRLPVQGFFKGGQKQWKIPKSPWGSILGPMTWGPIGNPWGLLEGVQRCDGGLAGTHLAGVDVSKH